MARNPYRKKSRRTDSKAFLENEKDIRKLAYKLRRASHAYHNTQEPIMSDTEYDYLEDQLRRVDPNHPFLKRVGASPTSRKTRLPYTMASLPKITDSDATEKWLKENAGPYVISDKLDGVSAMHVVSSGGAEEALYTRGNGLTGSDISSMLPSIRGIGEPPRSIRAVRGELVISKTAFAKTYSNDYSNPRNFVSGVVNATRTVKSGISDLSFFMHSVVDPDVPLWSVANKLKTAGYNIVPFVKRARIDEVWLLDYLAERRKKTKFEIDGLVVTAGNGNTIAFKAGYEMAEGEVKEVTWSLTRYGYIKPVVILKRGVRLAGATVKRVSAHNAKFVVDNKLGPGAIINVVRSGEVIPKIAAVVKGARKAQLPDDHEYEWNKTGVDFVSVDLEADDVVVRRMTEFLIRIGVDRVKEAQVRLLVADGIDNIPELLECKTHDFEDAGMGGRMATHLYTKLHSQMKKVDLPTLMAASGIFRRGMGTRRFETILNEVPFKTQVTIFRGKPAKLRERLASVPGVGLTTAADYVRDFKKFVAFVKEIKWKPQRVTIGRVRVSRLGPSPIVVFTGFRDPELTDLLKSVGGKQGSSVTKQTTHVVALNPKGRSTKLTKAQQLGIPILSVAEFRRRALK